MLRTKPETAHIEREGFRVGDTVSFLSGRREVIGVIRTFTGRAANQKYPFTVIANGDAYARSATDMTLLGRADDVDLREACEDLLAAYRSDYRTVGYRKDLWDRLAANIVKAGPSS